MTATTRPTIKLRKSAKGRIFGWRCTCKAWVNTTRETVAIITAEGHAKLEHPDGCTVEMGGLL